jgi:D-amino peptidase
MGPKIYIATDLEGISGVTTWEQTRDRTSPLFREACHLLVADINACVEGCLEGGASEIVVSDGHGGGFNLIPEELHPGATYITGPGRPRPACGMDERFDGLILLGYHAMNGVEDGVLHHTQSSLGENKYWYNGVECGEIVQTSLVAGAFGIPPILCTGDLRACEEARRFLGDQIITVVVKEGYSRTSCRMLAPKKARELIRDGARRAMGIIDRCQPFRMDLPITARLRLKDKEAIDRILENGRSRRIDDFTVERVVHNPLDIYEF